MKSFLELCQALLGFLKAVEVFVVLKVLVALLEDLGFVLTKVLQAVLEKPLEVSVRDLFAEMMERVLGVLLGNLLGTVLEVAAEEEEEEPLVSPCFPTFSKSVLETRLSHVMEKSLEA